MKKDLLKLQNNYFTASVENVKEANSAIYKAQGWVLTLGLAELAFLGSQKDLSSCIVKIEITLLLLAFILFVIGSIAQYKHLLKSSRFYFSLSSKVSRDIEASGTSEAKEIPNEFLDRSDTDVLKTNNVANYLLSLSFTLIGISTFLIWFSLIF